MDAEDDEDGGVRGVCRVLLPGIGDPEKDGDGEMTGRWKRNRGRMNGIRTQTTPTRLYPKHDGPLKVTVEWV